MKRICIILFLSVFCVTMAFLNSKIGKAHVESLNRQIRNLDLDTCDNLMIVSHPDDETIFGGMELLENRYLVVGITVGGKEERKKEFLNVLNFSNDQGIILGYPDKTFGKRDNWDRYYDDIEDDLREIIKLKEWGKIVTHNKDGEYGHIHHQLTNQMVSKYDNVFYFGKYFEEKDNDLTRLPLLNEESISKKKEMLSIYCSQEKVVDRLMHVAIREEILSKEEWEMKWNEI